MQLILKWPQRMNNNTYVYMEGMIKKLWQIVKTGETG